MRILFFLLFFYSTVSAQNNLPALEQWREHLPYVNTIDVTASSNKIYTATPYALFSINLTTNEVERISKVAGLSEVGISTIKFDPLSNKLIIAYTNSNIDVIDNKRINNIPEIKRENISGDKSIYHIYPANDLAFLSTGIGIVVINTNKYEIKDSWFIGNSGNYVKTYMFTRDNNFFYAATDEGLKRAPVNSNGADFRNWQTISGSNGLANAPSKGVVNVKGKIIALQNDSLFIQNGNTWQLFYANGFQVLSVNESENKITITQINSSGLAQVVILNDVGSVHQTIQQAGTILMPRKAIIRGNEVWVADEFAGLSKWVGNSFEKTYLSSPQSIATGEMVAFNNKIYAAAGSVNEAWNYQYNRSGFYIYGDNNWTNYNSYGYSKLDSLLDFVTIAVDPRDESVWAGSFGGGLVNLKSNNQFDIYKQNSPIGPAIGDPGSYRVSGLAFDQNNNLWLSNYGASQYIHVLKTNNTWHSFVAPFSLVENAVSQIVIDDADQKWIVAPKGNGLIAFNHGSSLENTNDDRWKLFKMGRGNGNLPSSDVLAIAKDKSGFIWVGTSDGIAVIQCATEIFTTNCEAVLPIAQQGNFANYLFKGEEVRSIAVDGADRKWIATKTGLWLINADGDKVIQHFTEDNSPLPSNDVLRVTINDVNGEVFIATSKGIISYRGNATAPAETYEKVVVYPNPVQPGYTGTIAIKGLKENSFIKITELNGRLVYQAKALGGQAIWNGKDYNGRQIASGVYLVLVTDEQKQDKAAAKIVFISR